jgi:hypothetical protein
MSDPPCHPQCCSASAEILSAAMATPEEVDVQPQEMSNWSAFFFFVAFVLVVSYTLLNLYIGGCSRHRHIFIRSHLSWCLYRLVPAKAALELADGLSWISHNRGLHCSAACTIISVARSLALLRSAGPGCCCCRCGVLPVQQDPHAEPDWQRFPD